MEIINAVGRRKTAIARVYLTPGEGNISINKTTLEKYFPSNFVFCLVKQPFEHTETIEKYNTLVNVKGGGFKAQAEAIRFAIARALCQINNDFRPILKKEGFLTRDARMVERKKYGHKKARKSFQFSKR